MCLQRVEQCRRQLTHVGRDGRLHGGEWSHRTAQVKQVMHEHMLVHIVLVMQALLVLRVLLVLERELLLLLLLLLLQRRRVVAACVLLHEEPELHVNGGHIRRLEACAPVGGRLRWHEHAHGSSRCGRRRRRRRRRRRCRRLRRRGEG